MKTIIENALLVDGTGSRPCPGSLVIDGGRIEEVRCTGRGRTYHGAGGRGNSVLDAQGMAVTPGFIDIHRHADAAVFRSGFGELELRQGLTTIVNGNCGLSAVPLGSGHEDEIASYLEPVTGPLGTCRFRDFASYRKAVREAALPLTCGMLAGTGTIRAAVCGYGKCTPSDEEIKKMQALLAEALSAGVLGISMGLEYAPECFCSTEDLLRMLAPARGCGLPLIMHVRSEGDRLHEALHEAVFLAAALRLPLHVSHIKCIGKRAWGHGAAESLSILDRAREDGLDVSCDVYPYTAGSTQLLQIIPPAFQAGGPGPTLAKLKDPAVRREIASVLAEPSDTFDNFVEMEGWENISVSAVRCERDLDCVGKNMMEIAALKKVTPLNAACDLLIASHGEVSMIDRYACEEDVRTFLSCPYASIISDSLYALSDMPHPRLYGSFARVLEKYVVQEKLFPLETAVRKMTAMPAAVLGLKHKGLLQAGCDADLLIFRPEDIRENATYENPRRFASGFAHIFVGGKEVKFT